MEELIERCVELREDGMESSDIRKTLTQDGIPEEDIKLAIRESDSIYLDLLRDRPAGHVFQPHRLLLKTIIVLAALGFLWLVFIGQYAIGLGLLLIMWVGMRRTGLLGKQPLQQSAFTKTKKNLFD